MPNERATVCVFLDWLPIPYLHRFWNKQEYIIDPEADTSGTITLPLPKYAPIGWYRLLVYLHDSNGDIDISDQYDEIYFELNE